VSHVVNDKPHHSGRGRLALIVLVIVALILAAWGILERSWTYSALAQETDDAALPRVTLIHPGPGPKVRKLDLPANLAAWFEAPIYAQVSGYVKMWYKDFGAKVKTGDVLAEINTPSLDAQYAAAQANYNVVMARYKLAVITAKRWANLRGTQAVSTQEVDVQAANAAAEKAQVDQAMHEVERYQALENFKKIVAPFDGIVTSRLVNVGDYVNAGGGDVNSRGSASELFTVADVHRMRVFVSVPQDYAAIISPQITAELTVPQYPGKTFKATFLATAHAFNSNTRTVTTELTLPNDQGELWPDSYATAHFEAPSDPHILILPEAALIFRAQGMQVATVTPQNRIRLVSVQVGVNFGTTAQILSGVTEQDRVVSYPTADMLDGQEVKVVNPTPGYNEATSAPNAAHTGNPNDDTRAMPNDNSPLPENGARQ